MSLSDYPQGYLDLNEQNSKQLNIVLEIEGLETLFSMGNLYKTPRYGDPITYGQADLVYGGLIPYDYGGSGSFKSYISLDSNLAITQRIEPESGKGSVSTLTLILVDVGQYVTQLMTPGLIIDEPLGNKFVSVKLGFLNSSYPEDYFTIFRGYISNVKYSQGKYFIQLSDPNAKRRGQVFFTPKNKLSEAVNDSQTDIPFNTADYYDQILGPDGTYDSAVKTYIQIDEEVMEYGAGSVAADEINPVTRASRDTVAAGHDPDIEVENRIQIEDNAINVALKTMLSGWNGPWLEGVECESIQDTEGSEGIIANALLLPIGKDALSDYGLVVNDWVTIGNSSSGNDGSKQISEIRSVNGGSNNLLLFYTDFSAVESPATGVTLAFRSQFDTLPIAAGMKLTPRDVDVARHLYYRDNFFTQAESQYRFYLKDAVKGKDWLEEQVYKPIGTYSITRFGRISMTMAVPPYAGDKLPILDHDGVIDPNSIEVERGINNRRYFNEIKYQYDFSDSDNFQSVTSILDTDSLSKITISSVLPIEAKGIRTDLNAETLIRRRGRFLINRYRQAAVTVKLKANWRAGSIIETGDIVLLKDDGYLQITNFETGERNLGQQLFEVIDRQYDIKTGTVAVLLMTGIGFAVSDRFGTITPSSLVVNGSTTTKIKFEDSFGSLYPGNEKKKWEDLVGLKVFVHSWDYANQSNEVTLLPFTAGAPYEMNVSPALNMTPSEGNIIDLIPYPDNTDTLDQALAKLLFCYITPTVPCTGVSNNVIQCAASDIDKFTVGLPVLVRNSGYSMYSDERNVQSIDTGLNQVTVESSWGVAPSDIQYAECIGYKDGGGPYRFL